MKQLTPGVRSASQHIFLCGDEPLIRMSMADMLTSCGHRVLEADSAASAV